MKIAFKLICFIFLFCLPVLAESEKCPDMNATFSKKDENGNYIGTRYEYWVIPVKDPSNLNAHATFNNLISKEYFNKNKTRAICGPETRWEDHLVKAICINSVTGERYLMATGYTQILLPDREGRLVKLLRTYLQSASKTEISCKTDTSLYAEISQLNDENGMLPYILLEIIKTSIQVRQNAPHPDL